MSYVRHKQITKEFAFHYYLVIAQITLRKQFITKNNVLNKCECNQKINMANYTILTAIQRNTLLKLNVINWV